MPFINGRYHMNPAHGRAPEEGRLAEAASQEPRTRAQGREEGHWVTIGGRHVFIKDPHQQTAKIAKKYDGSTDWAYGKRKDNFPQDTDKCNKFVYDVTKEAGAEALTRGSDGKMRPPLAGEWADPKVKIPNWEVLPPAEFPKPGDVAAYQLPGHATYTGHSGIVTSVDADGTVHAIAAHAAVVGPDDKFQRIAGVVFRRYIGGK